MLRPTAARPAPRRGRARVVISGVVAGLSVLLQLQASAALGAPAIAAAAGTCTLTEDQADQVRAVLAAMSTTTCATLDLAPGTYDIGAEQTGIHLHPGTAEQRITVRAADPAHPPLIHGALYLAEPTYWTFSGLHFEGTTENNVPGQPILGLGPLMLNGGNHLIVIHSEFSSTPGFQVATLLGIGAGVDPDTGQVDYPDAFTIRGNCFHDASVRIGSEDPSHDHLLYVATPYPRNQPHPLLSTVDHNIFFNSLNGAAAKVDQPDVNVFDNTFDHVDEAITLQPTPANAAPPYDYSGLTPLKRIVMVRNLISNLDDVVGKDGSVAVPRPFFVRDLDNLPNPSGVQASFVNNQTWNDGVPFDYVHRFNSSLSQFRSSNPAAHGRGRQLDPGYRHVGGCGPTFYRPTNPALKGFGRYAD